MISKISEQTIWQILGKIVSSLSTLFILSIVARNYGESGTGVFTLALTYLAIFYLLSDFGFNAHVLSRIKNNESMHKEWPRLFGTRLVWSGLLVFLALITLPFWPLTNFDFEKSVMFGSLSVIASGVFVSCNLIFQDKLKYQKAIISSTLGSLLGLFLIWWFSSMHYPLPFLLLGHFLSWLTIALVSLFLTRSFLSSIIPIFDIRYTKILFKESWPIALTLAVNTIYFRADAFILAYFQSSSVVGIYNLAYSFFQTALVLPTFIMNAYYPLMLEQLKTNKDKFMSQIKLFTIGLLVLGTLGTVTTFVLSPFILQLITGGGFLGADTSLKILSLGFPAFFVSALMMWVLVTQKKYKSMLSIYTLGLLFNIVLNLIYVPQYSFYAASIITVLSEYLILILQVVVLLFLKGKE